MVDTVRAQAAAVTALITRAIGTAGDGVRFCVVASRPGLDVVRISRGVADAVNMTPYDFRMSKYDNGAIGDDVVRQTMGRLHTPLVVLEECGEVPQPKLRDMVELLSGQTRNRHGEGRMVVVVLHTTSAAADAIQAVRDATGYAPQGGFVVLDDVAPVLEAA